jgi:integrase
VAKSKPAAARPGDPIGIDRVEQQILERCRADAMVDDRLRMMGRIFVILRVDCGVRAADELSRADILDRFGAAIAGFSVSYRRALNLTFRAMLRRALKMGLIGALPDFPAISHYLPTDRRSSPPTAADVRRLLDYLESEAGTWRGRRLHALTAAVALAGIDAGQAMRLRVTDVDLAGSTIWIPGRLWMGSRRPPAPVRMSSELRTILAGWIRRTKCEWAFPNFDRTGPWLQGRRGRAVKALLELQRAAHRAGIELVTFESLRRFHAENVAFDLPASWPKPATPSDPKLRPAVEIGQPGEPAFIRGKPKRRLARAQHRTIAILLEAWPGGMSKKAMTQQYGGEAWRQTLIRLRQDPDWASAVDFPGVGFPGKDSDLYRILPW